MGLTESDRLVALSCLHRLGNDFDVVMCKNSHIYSAEGSDVWYLRKSARSHRYKVKGNLILFNMCLYEKPSLVSNVDDEFVTNVKSPHSVATRHIMTNVCEAILTSGLDTELTRLAQDLLEDPSRTVPWFVENILTKVGEWFILYGIEGFVSTTDNDHAFILINPLNILRSIGKVTKSSKFWNILDDAMLRVIVPGISNEDKFIRMYDNREEWLKMNCLISDTFGGSPSYSSNSSSVATSPRGTLSSINQSLNHSVMSEDPSCPGSPNGLSSTCVSPYASPHTKRMKKTRTFHILDMDRTIQSDSSGSGSRTPKTPKSARPSREVKMAPDGTGIFRLQVPGRLGGCNGTRSHRDMSTVSKTFVQYRKSSIQN